MNILLKTKSLLARDRVEAETACTQRRCGAQPGHPCIGLRGPRLRLHQGRWTAWRDANTRLIAVVLDRSSMSPRVERAVALRLVQNDDWDVLFPSSAPPATAEPAEAQQADPGQRFAYLLDYSGQEL